MQTRKFGALKTPDEVLLKIPRMESIANIPRAPLPGKLDLRSQLMPIRDQENTSECVAFATSAMKEWQAGQQINIHQYFSPEFIYDKRSNNTQDGMYPADAMNIVKTYGCPLDASYPFQGTAVGDVTAQAANFKINSYALVSTAPDLKTALTTYGPCTITFPYYNDSMMFWRQNSGDSQQGGHCVLVAGFDDTQQWFIIRNSWGDGWGDHGYCYYPYTDWGIHWECYSAVEGACSPNFPQVIPAPNNNTNSSCCSGCVLM